MKFYFLDFRFIKAGDLSEYIVKLSVLNRISDAADEKLHKIVT